MSEYVSKRLERSQKATEAARRDLVAGDSAFAAEHAYYAMFYTAEALLAQLDLGFSSHGAVHGAYGMHFAKTGLLDPEYHRWLLDAFEGFERPPGKRSGDAPRPSMSALPLEIEEPLKANPRAWDHFQRLPPSQRRAYVGWIASAKRPETRERRIREATALLAAGNKLGLK